ncbi:MAG: hypothetical protein V4598_07880 [Bdellovibrionota bacterium]
MLKVKDRILNDEIVEIKNFFEETQLSQLKNYFNSSPLEEFPFYRGRVVKLTPEMTDELRRLIESKLDIKLDPTTSKARIRVTNKHDQHHVRSTVHFDPYEFTGVFPLSYPTNTEDQGTRFYRHKISGKVKATPFVSEMLLNEHGHDLSQWEVRKKNDLGLNSVVFFNGGLFHGPPEIFCGESDEDGRITLDFFSNYPKEEK